MATILISYKDSYPFSTYLQFGTMTSWRLAEWVVKISEIDKRVTSSQLNYIPVRVGNPKATRVRRLSVCRARYRSRMAVL